MTRGCHPNSQDPQTDIDQYQEEWEGIASYLIVEISPEIRSNRPAEGPSHPNCSHNASQRVSGEEVARCGGVDWSHRPVAEAKEDYKDIEHPGRGGVPHKEKKSYPNDG